MILGIEITLIVVAILSLPILYYRIKYFKHRG
jgi:hypothetical protein